MTSFPLPPDDRIEVPIVRLDPELPPPTYAQPGDAGADIVTAQDVELAPGQRTLVGTGLAMAVPPGFAAFVHPRSGLAHRVGLSIVNAPGTIDSGYRGELKVILINLDPVQPLSLARGDRIAQLVFQRVELVRFVETDELTGSERGAGGYGSTGGAAVLATAAGGSSVGAEGVETSEVGG